MALPYDALWPAAAVLAILLGAAAWWLGRIRAAARALLQTEQRLRSLAALSSDFFWETDAKGCFTHVEGKVEEVLGVAASEALGRGFWELGLRVNGEVAQSEQIALHERREPFREVEFVRLDALRSVVKVLRVSGEARLGTGGRFLGYRGVVRDVTEHSRLEAKVRRAQGRLRLMIDAMPGIVAYIGRDERYIFVNQGHASVFGVPPQDVPGRTVREVVGEADYAMVRPYLERAIAGEEVRFERRRRQPDGTLRDLRSHYAPELDPGGRVRAVVVLTTDVTEVMQAREALRTEHDRLSRVLETMAEGLSILDAQGRYVLANAAAERIIGASRDDFIGRHYLEVPWKRHAIAGRTGSTPQDGFERLRSGATRAFGPESYVMERADGTRRVLSHHAARLEDEAGGFAGVVVTFEDVTERNEAEARLAESEQRFRSLAETAQAQEREVQALNVDLERRVLRRTAELTAAYREAEAFSTLVSHDLRAPLRAISGFSRILLEDFRGEMPGEAERLVGRVAQNAERMGALIDGLLEFGRLSRQPLRLQRVRPGDLAREVVEEQGIERDGRKVEFRIGEMPECRADPVLLKQVYVNLISNALKYTRRRAEARIEVGSIMLGLGPVYYVRDNGAGFDMALSKKLFGMFERLHLAQEFEGTGVGLALVQRIVERHGGKVWADSAPERGATFFFRIEDESAAGRDSARAVA